MENYLWIIDDDLYLRSFLESVKLASIATIGCLLIGYPMAYGITMASRGWKTVLLMMVVLPFWTSFLIRVYAWIGLLGNKGIINSLLIWLGVIKTPIIMLENNIGIIIGLIYSYLPFMILPLYASLEKIGRIYLEASYDLGCPPAKSFFKIIIPLSYKGMISGSMLVFIPAVGEFVIPVLLGGSSSLMIGKVLWNEFFINNDWPMASSLVVMLFFILFIPIFILQNLFSLRAKQKA